jgi:hypothetical protein
MPVPRVETCQSCLLALEGSGHSSSYLVQDANLVALRVNVTQRSRALCQQPVPASADLTSSAHGLSIAR